MFQNKFKNLVLILALTLTAQQSHAFFVISPSLGYKMQTIKLTDTADVDKNVKMSDPTYGLKLGLQSMTGVGFDLSGDYTSGKSKISTSGTEQESNYTHTTAAAQLSVAASAFKIYLGYVFMNEISLKNDIPANSSKIKGTGYQAGIALALSSSFSLGAEYQIDQFSQINIASVGSFEDIKNQYKKIDSQSTTIILAYRF